MALPGLHRRTALAIGCLLLAGSVAGCGSGSVDSTASAAANRDARLSFNLPAGWHRVQLAGLPGAAVPLEIASTNVHGAVRTICDPHRIVAQLPPGGALVQILEESGTARQGDGVASQVKDPRQYPVLQKPFHLGPPQAQECGEAYKTTSFRVGGQVFGLRVWAAPSGASAAVRGQIEQLMDGVREGPPTGPARLTVSYGPYLGVRCPRANSTRCDRIGLDLVLMKRVAAVSASIAGRPIRLTTPGLHNGIRGRDWVGSLRNAGMRRKGSPLHIPTNRRTDGIWAGNPPVYVPIRVTATYPDGHGLSRTFPHVSLAPGWG